jgi:hypothetical protein
MVSLFYSILKIEYMNRLRTCIRGGLGAGGGGGVVRPPRAGESKERQNDYFRLKTDFMSSTDFQLLNQTEGNFVTFFFNFMIPFKDGHCDYSPRAPKNANYTTIFTFMLPCIVIDFFSNNQQDALIIQIYFVVKLCMFRASSLPIVRSPLLYIRH